MNQLPALSLATARTIAGASCRANILPALTDTQPVASTLVPWHATPPVSAWPPSLDALEQDTVVALRRGGDRLELANLDGTKYADLSFSVDPNQVGVGGGGGYKGVWEGQGHS